MAYRGYIAKIKDVDVFITSEEEYEMENPKILYIVTRENEIFHLVLQDDKIVGYADTNNNVHIWTKEELPDFSQAGVYNELEDREAAYLKIEELAEIYDKAVDSLTDYDSNEVIEAKF